MAHDFDRYSAVAQMANEARRTAETAAAQVDALANQMDRMLTDIQNDAQGLDRKVDLLLAEAAERKGRSLEREEAERHRAEAIETWTKRMEIWLKVIPAFCAALTLLGAAVAYLMAHFKP